MLQSNMLNDIENQVPKDNAQRWARIGSAISSGVIDNLVNSKKGGAMPDNGKESLCDIKIECLGKIGTRECEYFEKQENDCIWKRSCEKKKEER